MNIKIILQEVEIEITCLHTEWIWKKKMGISTSELEGRINLEHLAYSIKGVRNGKFVRA